MMATTGMMPAQQTTTLVELVKLLEGQVTLIAAGIISLSAGALECSWTHSQLPQHLAALKLSNNMA